MKRNLDLLRCFNRLLEPEPSFGLELCKLGLMDAVWGSLVDRKLWSLRYLQEGRLRLITEIAHGDLHGEFLLFYPDGKPWMKGAYQKNRLLHHSMKIFMPDGSLLRETSPTNNVIPFPQRRN